VSDNLEPYRRFAAQQIEPGWGTELRIWLRRVYGRAYHYLLQAIGAVQRLQVRLIVRLALPEAIDADKLKARLFVEPPSDPAEKALRDALTSLLAMYANKRSLIGEDWGRLLGVMRGIEPYDRDWAMRLVAPALNRKTLSAPAPAISPNPEQPQAQGFLGGVVASAVTPLFAYVSMGLAAALVLTGGWAWSLSLRLDHAKMEEAKARAEAHQLSAENKDIRHQLKDAEGRVTEANRSTMETAERAREVIQREVDRRQRDNAQAKAERIRREKELADNPSGIIRDPNEWLRQLAAPAQETRTAPAPGDAGSAASGSPSIVPGSDRGTPKP